MRYYGDDNLRWSSIDISVLALNLPEACTLGILNKLDVRYMFYSDDGRNNLRASTCPIKARCDKRRLFGHSSALKHSGLVHGMGSYHVIRPSDPPHRPVTIIRA